MKRKIIIVLVVLIIVVGGASVWYVFFKPHRNVGAEKAQYELSADSLSKAFTHDNAAATATYINKAVLVEGEVTGIEGNTISLHNVACNIDSTELSKIPTVKTGSTVKLQGLVVGYNDLLEEVTLASCVFK
jgi:hypothetical protein